jgi:hypothetical protein
MAALVTAKQNQLLAKLQAAGLISYSRGKINVLDRPKLEERVCECYAVVKRESDRLFPSGKFLPL